MIFLWGRRNKVLEAYSDGNFECEKCNTKNLIYIVTQNYYHLFWIPIVPNNKFIGTYCPDCLDSIEFIYGKTSAKLEKQTRTPIYMYSLVIILGILILYVIVNSLNYSSKQKDLIKDPIKEDVYSLKFKDSNGKEAYSFIKVIDISRDSVFLVSAGRYFYQDVSYYGSSFLFLNDTIRKSKQELIKMYNSDDITKIYRIKD